MPIADDLNPTVDPRSFLQGVASRKAAAQTAAKKKTKAKRQKN
jgi:hypothetical protein